MANLAELIFQFVLAILSHGAGLEIERNPALT
jgi:hypothetical protein